MLSSVGFTTQWRGQPDTFRRRWIGLLGASLVLHAPVSPLMLLLGILGIFSLQKPPALPTESLNAIPIDILQTDEEPGESEGPPDSVDDVVVTEPDGEELMAPVPDAGVQDEPEDAGLPDSSLADGGPEDADLGEGGLEDAAADDEMPGPAVRDPVALAAEKTKVVDSNAAVSLTVYSENVRKHPLGARVGRVMAQLPQWQDFFGPSGIDPVRDIDRIMLVGPDFRDTSGLAVLVQHSLPNGKIYNAVDALVKRSKGGAWLEGTKLPAAEVFADRAERVFVIPSSYLVIVSPMSAKASALSVPRTLRIPDPEGDEALVGILKQPGYAFQKHGAPLTIPPTIESLKYWITPLPDGGGNLRSGRRSLPARSSPFSPG